MTMLGLNLDSLAANAPVTCQNFSNSNNMLGLAEGIQ